MLQFSDASGQYMNNLGTSVVEVSLILKNLNPQTKRIAEGRIDEFDIYQKLLDYDLENQNNEVLKTMNNLNQTLAKILEPLDQLNVDEYSNLTMPVPRSEKEADWIINSKISVEELKAILNTIFADDNEKHIRLKLPNLYESYSEDFQMFNFGKFLLELILITPISTLKKISMLFCVCTHYQNITHSGTQKITVNTLNSLIR